MKELAASGYTHTVNYHKKVDGLGWLFHSFPTTRDALPLHMKSLYRQQVSGVVRNIEAIVLK